MTETTQTANAVLADPKRFRKALGAFATGVTIVTARDTDGRDVAMTASSFNSVSLDPPLVLWSIARSAGSLSVFMTTDHFAVHVLAADQQSLSDRFSRRSEDRFAGLELGRGQGDVPLLEGCTGRFQCRTVFRYEGGDHVILVGEVLEYDHEEKPPLIFHGGGYGLVVRRPVLKIEEPSPEQETKERRRLLTYLLAVAHELVIAGTRKAYQEVDLSEEQYFVLSSLALKDDATPQALLDMIAVTGRPFAPDILENLATRKLVSLENGLVQLSTEGRTMTEQLFTATKQAEAEATQNLEEGELLLLQKLLRKVIRHVQTSSDVQAP